MDAWGASRRTSENRILESRKENDETQIRLGEAFQTSLESGDRGSGCGVSASLRVLKKKTPTYQAIRT